MKFFVCKFKSLILPFIICTFIIFLLIFSKNNLLAAKTGLNLWASSVVPTLLPFFIATELLGYTNVVLLCGKLLKFIMRPIFNVPGEGAFPLLMGIISGYPVGAKIVANLKEQKLCTDVEAERLLSFTNNSGPLFIVGTVGVGLFSNPSIGFTLLITHILSCLTVGFIFRWWGINREKNYRSNEYVIENNSNLSFNNLGEVLAKSIVSSINTCLMIGGFVVLFSIIISMLQTSKIFYTISNLLNIIGVPQFVSIGLITGFIEVTNGISFICNQIFNCNLKIILCAFVLGFGGFSVLLQVLSITSKAKISIKPYFVGKLLQAFFAAFYTYLII